MIYKDRGWIVCYTVLGILLLDVIASCAAETYNYTIQEYEVPLDHFSFSSNKTFKIRYLTNDTFKGHSRSPIFFYTGNEGNIELFAKNTGFMWEFAREIGASLVFAEHRYYGESLPFGNKSYDSPEYLGYLTSEQALADFADLLSNHVNPDSRPVIAFGGSYGGMLAAWFRIKYPHIVTGAIAASAPILQFKADCNRFNTILTSVFTATDRHCSENIRKSWKIIKNLSTTPEGRTTLNSKFKFCKALNATDDQKDFVEYLTDVYGNLAMVNYPYETHFLAPLPPYPVTQFCSHLNQSFEDGKLLDALQQAISVYANYTGQTKCLDIKSAYDSNMGAQGWDFQSCTEMVMPMCSKGDDRRNMFPAEDWDFQKYSDDCFKKFNVRPSKNMATTIYGGNKLVSASNIVFSNGLQDPWSGGGVLRSPNDDIVIVIIPDAAHHLDLRASNANDPGSVRQARNMEKEAIRKWLENDDFQWH